MVVNLRRAAQPPAWAAFGRLQEVGAEEPRVPHMRHLLGGWGDRASLLPTRGQMWTTLLTTRDRVPTPTSALGAHCDPEAAARHQVARKTLRPRSTLAAATVGGVRETLTATCQRLRPGRAWGAVGDGGLTRGSLTGACPEAWSIWHVAVSRVRATVGDVITSPKKAERNKGRRAGIGSNARRATRTEQEPPLLHPGAELCVGGLGARAALAGVVIRWMR